MQIATAAVMLALNLVVSAACLHFNYLAPDFVILVLFLACSVAMHPRYIIYLSYVLSLHIDTTDLDITSIGCN